MSAREPPAVEQMAQEFPITPEEAQAIADAMTPFQNLTDVGSAFGNTLEDVPGAGPQLVGSVLRQVSTQVNLASQSAEVLARAIDFYVTTQAGTLEEAFPPPQEVARLLREDFAPLRELAAEGFQQPQQPGGPFG